jgi:hypothetical protein
MKDEWRSTNVSRMTNDPMTKRQQNRFNWPNSAEYGDSSIVLRASLDIRPWYPAMFENAGLYE